MNTKRNVYIMLGVLIAVDLIFAIMAFVSPQLWFKIFHSIPYVTAHGFLKRCGADWLAFAVLQTFAFFRWEKRPYWLAIVAGVRFSNIFTDWTYLWFAPGISMFGRLSLFLVSPFNLMLGFYFLWRYRIFTASTGRGEAAKGEWMDIFWGR